MNSVVYEYKRHTNRFQIFQEIPTFGARDIETFTIMGNKKKHMLIVANYQTGFGLTATHNVESVMYEFSEQTYITGRFEEYQKIQTKGAVDWEAITSSENVQAPLLVVANQHSPSGNDCALPACGRKPPTRL